MMKRKLFGIPLLFILLGVAAVVGLLVILNLGAIVNGLINLGGDVLTVIFNRDRIREDQIIECSDSAGCRFWHPILYSAILLFTVITGFAYTTLLERKLVARFQQRVGPNRVGPWGLLQPAADGVKLIFKEDIMPSGANRPIYLIAPLLKAAPTLIVLAVIPLGPSIVIPWFGGDWYRVPLQVADIGVGVLYILAITSIGTYGVALMGWASNNKYAMLGGLRASAQMISYELSMGLTLAVPVMIVGSMSVLDIVIAQGGLFVNWLFFQNPLAALILCIALIAEVHRAPFDLPEAEQELTAGFMTEYSGMKFALIMMSEYLGMIGVSMIAASTFFGGYQDGFGLVDSLPILGPLVMIGKVVLFLAAFVWIRATLPRIRYDRLMSFGWKIMLPLALLAVVWTAIAVVVGEELGRNGYLIVSTVLVALVAIIGGAIVLRSGDRSLAEEDDVEDDPVITGEPQGIGYIILQLIGGLVAIPFLLFNFTVKQLENLASIAPVEEPTPAPPETEDPDQATLPAQTGSGD
jgi:NADH-quinone oxidoreductase subunit H